MNKQSITKYAVAIVLGLGVVLGVSSLQAAWTTPAGAPPGSNVDAPVNVGATSQSKLGQLFINTDANTPFTVGLSVFGKAIFNGGVQILSGAGANKILTSDANGNATWTTPSSGGGGEANSCNSVDTGQGTNNVAWTGTMTLSLLKGSQNICTDAGGCSWKAFSYDSSAAASNIKFDSFYIQNASSGAWKENNDSGINGNTTYTYINTSSGFGIWDDFSGVDTTKDALVVQDTDSTRSYTVSFCDF